MIFADVGVGQFVACGVVISIDVFDGRFGCCVVADFQSMFSIVGLDVGWIGQVDVELVVVT